MSSNESNGSNETEQETEQEPRRIFRKVSLERLANPEQLDNLLVVVTSKVWITLLTILLLGAIFLSWLIFGSVPIQVKGRGIVMNPQGLQFYVPVRLGGIVRQLYVKPGAFIEEGALIAEIFDSQEELKRKGLNLRSAKLLDEEKNLQEEMDQKAPIGDEASVDLLKAKLKALTIELGQVKEESDLLEARLPYYKIYSQSEGHVLEVLPTVGDYVESGSPVVWMEHLTRENAPHYVYGYFPVEDGKRLAIGKNVKIKISTVDSQEYGYLIGIVKQISDYAVSKQSILKLIHNKELTDYLTWDNQAVVQVLIAIETKPSPLPGKQAEYYWTSGKTPPVIVTSGTLCEIQAVAGHIPPLFYFLPLSFLKLPGEN